MHPQGCTTKKPLFEAKTRYLAGAKLENLPGGSVLYYDNTRLDVIDGLSFKGDCGKADC